MPEVKIPRTTGVSSTKNEIYAIINNPQDGSSFKSAFNVNGVAKNIPTKNHLWLIVSPRESIECWPQYKEIIPNENTGAWNGKVEIGGANGKLLDIVLVSADTDANKYFNDYISNQDNENFPLRPMPKGTKSLAHVTVIKASENDSTSQSVNKNYGFSKSGVFYIHKSLITQSNGEIPCLVAGVTNWTNKTKMSLDGDYYIYEAKIDSPFKTKYCFYIGNGNYIPQLLIEKSSSKILDGDYTPNDENTGNNFYTNPQDYYPGN
jgi:hypothetical protein